MCYSIDNSMVKNGHRYIRVKMMTLNIGGRKVFCLFSREPLFSGDMKLRILSHFNQTNSQLKPQRSYSALICGTLYLNSFIVIVNI